MIAGAKLHPCKDCNDDTCAGECGGYGAVYKLDGKIVGAVQNAKQIENRARRK